MFKFVILLFRFKFLSYQLYKKHLMIYDLIVLSQCTPGSAGLAKGNKQFVKKGSSKITFTYRPFHMKYWPCSKVCLLNHTTIPICYFSSKIST